VTRFFAITTIPHKFIELVYLVLIRKYLFPDERDQH
jgi:hypothetical protein